MTATPAMTADSSPQKRSTKPRAALGPAHGQRALLHISLATALLAAGGPALHAGPFEARVNVMLTRSAQTNTWLYTFGPEHLRIEVTGSTNLSAVDIIDRSSGGMTLLFPWNRSFVHLTQAPQSSHGPGQPLAMGMPVVPVPPVTPRLGIGSRTGAEPNQTAMPVMPAMPMMPAIPATANLSPGLPAGIGPLHAAGAPGQMPVMPMGVRPGQGLGLKATGQTTNLLGCACQRYEIAELGRTMEIWATDQLPPYQPYVANQSRHFGARMLEESWMDLVANKKLFPLLANLRNRSGAVRLHFEVTSVTPEKIAEPNQALFHPPADYLEVRPLPF